MEGHRRASGSYTGDGTNAVTVDIGFRPTQIVIWNKTDGTMRAEIIDDGADGQAFKILDSGSGTTDLSRISSNAPVLNNRGFSTGTDASLIVSAKVFNWIAF